MLFGKKVVVCGSFHRDLEGLRRVCVALLALGCQVLSPRSLDFKDAEGSFVRTKEEVGFSEEEIERWHLQAINLADFVWLHAPEGYVGISGAFEAGFSTAKGIPIFSSSEPKDPVLIPYVNVVSSPIELLFTDELSATIEP